MNDWPNVQSMDKILLIKTGAAGDVVRTTTLLNSLPGQITWVVDKRYRGLLPAEHSRLAQVVNVNDAFAELSGMAFDWIISLEEDLACAQLASFFNTKKLTGIYSEGETISYTPDSACWFDMSLVSKKGKAAANELKMQNRQSFQELLFQVAGLSFNGEPYCIYRNAAIQPVDGVVAIETRAGARWPNKAWGGYTALTSLLEKEGYRVKLLAQQKNLTDYLDDIAGCSFLISGDTLAMHIALAYKIPSIAIFNCTSVTEIYDYGTLQKIESPLLMQSFYSREFSAEVINSITPETVHAAFAQYQLTVKRLV